MGDGVHATLESHAGCSERRVLEEWFQFVGQSLMQGLERVLGSSRELQDFGVVEHSVEHAVVYYPVAGADDVDVLFHAGLLYFDRRGEDGVVGFHDLAPRHVLGGDDVEGFAVAFFVAGQSGYEPCRVARPCERGLFGQHFRRERYARFAKMAP